MFCGKKKRTVNLQTKVASDDLNQMQIILSHYQFKLDKNMGLISTNVTNKSEIPSDSVEDKELNDLRKLEQELKESNEKFVQVEKKYKENKKRDLFEKLKYEKVKGKLIDILQEYEQTVNSIS